MLGLIICWFMDYLNLQSMKSSLPDLPWRNRHVRKFSIFAKLNWNLTLWTRTFLRLTASSPVTKTSIDQSWCASRLVEPETWSLEQRKRFVLVPHHRKLRQNIHKRTSHKEQRSHLCSCQEASEREKTIHGLDGWRDYPCPSYTCTR